MAGITTCRQTDRHRQRPAGRHANMQTDRQADGQRLSGWHHNMQTGRQTGRHRHTTRGHASTDVCKGMRPTAHLLCFLFETGVGEELCHMRMSPSPSPVSNKKHGQHGHASTDICKGTWPTAHLLASSRHPSVTHADVT